MIGISKLYCGTVEPSDALRYGRKSHALPSHLLQFAEDKKPVVVWNCTRRCNLKCVHCYSHSQDIDYGGEMTTDQGKKFLDDLAAFGSPVILFSGGEPLTRKDLFELITHARTRGLRAVVSTNGTLINHEQAGKLKEADLSYVGISIDGLRETNNTFRRTPGAFERALDGVRACTDRGLKVGLRFTITKHNVRDIPGIFDLIEKEKIPRICFYHLVYAGRGAELMNDDLSHQETRAVVDLIIDRTAILHKKGLPTEVLTVDNHCDGIYLYLRMLKENNPRADQVMELLKMNGGNSSGVGIGCVGWDGSVHADQFWRHYTFGNVIRRPFSEIWTDRSDPLMKKLKNKKRHVKGRCAQCTYLDVCGGNFRVRAEAVYGDIWAQEPACYLTDNEIGLE
ncbi:MAG: 12,18-didecarboxysiroheme deacetylase [Chitinivibrionales bacterium]|nr:12,18-didecarboxysiroheme deacetylase [Chitinivibrionales bacterium]